MTPHLAQAIAEQRIADLRREAAMERLAAIATAPDAAAASGSPRRRVRRLHRLRRLLGSLGGRRYRRVELVWPDGVCSVVPARSEEPTHPLAGSRK